MNDVNDVNSILVKNADIILSVDIPSVIKTVKNCNGCFDNIKIDEEEVCWVLGALGGLIGGIFLGEVGSVIALISVGILLVKGETLNNTFNLIPSAYKILENESISDILTDKDKLNRTLNTFIH